MMRASTLLLCLCLLAGAVEAQAPQSDPLPEAALRLDAAARGMDAAATSYQAQVSDKMTEAEQVKARELRKQCRGHLDEANRAFDEAQALLEVDEGLRQRLPIFDPRGHSDSTAKSWRKAAARFRSAARLLRESVAEGDEKRSAELETMATAASTEAFEAAELGANQDALITDDFYVLAVLLGVLALLFSMNAHPSWSKLFKVIPLLVFAYFLPTLLSNLHLIPIASPLYTIIKKQLLPASLVLLVLSVDIPAVLGLGRNALLLFLTATVSIVIGGPLALLLCKGLIPESMSEEAWKGLAALSGSWIGGGANFVAIGESVGVSASTLSMMVVVDVAVAQVWMIVLLFFAGREKSMDEKIGADRGSLDEVRDKIAKFEAEVSRPTTLADLMTICAIGFGVTAIANALAKELPPIGDVVKGFTWVVLLCTTMAVALSFTRVRRLEGAGASKLGSVLLYLLVASIGAHAQFSKVLQVPSLMIIGAVWMLFHAVVLLVMRRVVKAPIFFAAVGSKANVGGAASAPILASAFHPALAPVGVLLAVVGYVLGTYAGIACAWLLELVH